MGLAETLARGRALAEADMTDECVITIETGEGDFDETTGKRGPAPTATVYPVPGKTGVCRLQVKQVQPDVPTSGGHRYVLSTIQVSLPVTAPTVPADAQIRITKSKFDPLNVGRTFTVQTGARKSQATAYRIQVEEVAG